MEPSYTKFKEEKFLNGKLYYRSTRNGAWSEYNKDRLVEMYMELKERLEKPVGMPKLPDYYEIDEVSHDQSNLLSWDNVRFQSIYKSGFIDGALWMKSEIENKYYK